jgi:hypothetical protein
MAFSPTVFFRTSIRLALVGAPALSIACATSGSQPSEDGGGPSSFSSSGSGSSGSGSSGSSSSSGGSSGSSSSSSGSSSGGLLGSDASTSSSGSSTGPDGGAPDAATTPEGGIGGAAAAIHDDFETGSLGKWTVTDPFGNALQPPATVAIDTTAMMGHVHGGTYSVKVHNGGLIGVAPPSAAFYGRFWVWLGTNPSPGRGSGGHWAWAVGAGLLGGAAAEIRQGGQFDILIDNNSVNDDIVLSDPNLFNDSDGGVTPPVGQWICMEFFYGKDSLRTWIQGTEITALDVTPTTVWAHAATTPPWSPAYSAIRIGYAGYNGNLIDLWLDDVALDSNRIGCN